MEKVLKLELTLDHVLHFRFSCVYVETARSFTIESV